MYFLLLQVKGWVIDMTFQKTFNAYKGITKRNIKVYLKDKTAIVFSMMTQIIILGLYLLFLKQNYVDSLNSMFDSFHTTVDDKLIDSLVNSWLVSGVIGTAVITVAMNALTVMISDKQNKIDYDYSASSVKGSTIVMSYFSGAVINTIVISAVLLTAGIVFWCVSGSHLPQFTEFLQLYGLVILGSVSAVIILMFFVSFFKKNSSYAAFNTLVSVAIGFVIGAYIPVTQFSDSVQTLVNLVPGSHVAGMIRNILVSPCINDISAALNGADNGLFAEQAEKSFAVNLNIFGNEVDFSFMMIYTLGAIALFLVLNLVSYKFSSKRKS